MLKKQRFNLEKTTLQHNSNLDIYDEPVGHMRKTGIICTIGPASKSVETLAKLMLAGMDVVRLNFSHGTHDYHASTIANARKAAADVGKIVAIALDTKGPEIRTGNFIDGKEVVLEVGAKVRITTNDKYYDQGSKDIFWVDYKNMPKVVPIGGTVYVDDGLLSLKVVSKGADFLDCEVVNSAAISNHKGVNLPNVDVDLPALSPKDLKDLAFGVEQGVDMVFASFIRKKEDIFEIRKALGEKGKHIQIISKIENHEGVRNFDEILEATDGVMVARGDLGIEVPPQKVFLAQKMMISKCSIVGKPSIVATQMLESMIKNPRPTRAEVSDVANAVNDGADCVMLSGETAKGKYPVEAVTMMAKVCVEAEYAQLDYQNFNNVKAAQLGALSPAETVCCCAVMACLEQNAKLIIVMTNSGLTGRMISKFRPPVPILCVVGASHAGTARQLAISRACLMMTYDDTKGKPSADARVSMGIKEAQARNLVKTGDFIVCVHADIINKGYANLMKIVQVGS